MIWNDAIPRHRDPSCVGNRCSRWRLATGALFWLAGICGCAPALLRAQTPKDASQVPLIFRLDPQTRLRVFLALGLIVVLGLVAIAFIRLAGRLVRLYAEGSRYQTPWSTPPGATDDWAAPPRNEHPDAAGPAPEPGNGDSR